jgi:hypothetical protein
MSKRDSDDEEDSARERAGRRSAARSALQLGRQEEAEEAQRAYRASIGADTRLQRPKTKAERTREAYGRTLPGSSTETAGEAGAGAAPRRAGGPAVVVEAERPIARTLRLVAAWMVVAAIAVFFDPAFHDAIRRSEPILRLGGEAGPGDATFYLDVRTRPAGAVVRVNGRERGVTPLLLNIGCVAGDPVTIEVERRGHEPERTVTRCAPGKTFSFTPTLR